MPSSQGRILTTHVGALPGPPDVWGHSKTSDMRMAEAVAEVVQMQQRIGIDLINEGELTKRGGWASFMRQRVGGLEPATAEEVKKSRIPEFERSHDRRKFAEFYKAATEKGTLFEQTGTAHIAWDGEDPGPRICRGPISYVGADGLNKEIDMLKKALGPTPVKNAFLSTVAPASFEWGIINGHYKGEEEFVYAVADVLAVEYEAIANAGLTVQVDDAFIPALWDFGGIDMGLETYRRYAALRLEALNHSLRNVPREQIRYHLCWGSWHGPHAFDLPLNDIVDLVLKVKTSGYLIEAANARHEHEWRVWNDVELPDGVVLFPGVVSHATTLIEHPDLVCDRIVRFAEIVGRERVIASTDCGLGSRCHPQIAWAKLETLVEGAKRASEVLY